MAKQNQTPAVFRLARPDERQRVTDFINENFDWRLPLVNRREFFDYYYIAKDGGLQFALAERDGEILSVCGYIPASEDPHADIWASIWVANKKARGIGLELMSRMQQLTGAKLVACNNIRKNTCSLYHFLGWTAERLPHFFRLSKRGAAENYRLCRPAVPEGGDESSFVPTILPVGGDLLLKKIENEAQLDEISLPTFDSTPKKDKWYLKKRYFNFPHLCYDLYRAEQNGETAAILVCRTVMSGEEGEIPVLRIVDFLGEQSVLPRIGTEIDRLMREAGAEYADCYCAGISADTFAAAGFCERMEGDGNIIPNYLTPPAYENTEYYYFTSDPARFRMFKADGDQDRPNLPADC